MKTLLYILVVLVLAACRHKTDMQDIELRADGLTYSKTSNQLVNGEVVSKIEGRLAESHQYRDGRALGRWYQYDPKGAVVSSGTGETLDQFQHVVPGQDLSKSTISVVNAPNLSYATVGLYNEKVFSDSASIFRLAKAMFTIYRSRHGIETILMVDQKKEFTFDSTILEKRNFRFDTLSKTPVLKVRVR